MVAGVAATIADFPTGTRRRCRRYSHRRLPSSHADLAGEPRVTRRSSWTSSPPPCWPELPPESRLALCSPWPSCPAPGQRGLPAGGPWAPSVRCPGSIWPGCEKFLCAYFISENYRKLYNLVKCISFDRVVKKICMIYQNVHKNMLYMFMSNSCMFIQL
jgi:hypothetical protein